MWRLDSRSSCGPCGHGSAACDSCELLLALGRCCQGRTVRFRSQRAEQQLGSRDRARRWIRRAGNTPADPAARHVPDQSIVGRFRRSHHFRRQRPRFEWQRAWIGARRDNRRQGHFQIRGRTGVSDVAWSRGSAGWFFTSNFRAPQISFQPYPIGDAVRVSNNTSEYGSLSMTADGKSLVASERRRQATVYVSDSPSSLDANVSWRFAPISREEFSGTALDWTPSDRLLEVGGDWRSYVMNADGSQKAPLAASEWRGFRYRRMWPECSRRPAVGC